MSTSKAKKEKRKKKKDERRTQHQDNKISKWKSGKLVKENANGDKYSKGYTIELRDRLMDLILFNLRDPACIQNPFMFYHRFLQTKSYIRDLLVYWSGDVERKDDYKYWFLKKCYEIYLDNAETLGIQSTLMGLIQNEREKDG